VERTTRVAVDKVAKGKVVKGKVAKVTKGAIMKALMSVLSASLTLGVSLEVHHVKVAAKKTWAIVLHPARPDHSRK